MKFQLSNILAILGVLSIVVGVSMIYLPAGVIMLGLFLLLGSIATMKADAQKATLEAIKKAVVQ